MGNLASRTDSNLNSVSLQKEIERLYGTVIHPWVWTTLDTIKSCQIVKLVAIANGNQVFG